MGRFKWFFWTLALSALVIAGFYFLRPAPYRILVGELPPYSYIENGKPSGVSVDIVKEGMKRLKVNYQLLASSGDEGEVKGPKTMLLAAPKLASSEKLFKWAGPIATMPYYLFGKKGQKHLGSLNDAQNASSIGVVKGDMSYDVLVGKDFRNLYFATSKEAAFEKMLNGEIALFAGSQYEVKALLAKKERDPSQVQNLFFLGDYDLYMAFSRDIPDKLVKRWQAVFDAMRKEGYFEKVRSGYENSKLKQDAPKPKKK